MSIHEEFEDICSSSKKGATPLVPDEPTMMFTVGEDYSEQKADEPVKRPLDDSDDMYLLGDEEPMKPARGERSLNSFSKKSKKRKSNQKIKMFNILVSTLLVLSLICTGVLGVAAYYLGDMSQVYIPDNHEELGIDKDLIADLPKGITNIALFGLDSRSRVTDDRTKAMKGLSDSIIILSVNTNNNTVKLTSILRDSYVPVDGHGTRKITEAYSLGGAALALKTLNKNFGLNITDYVSVSLFQLWKVIDFLGGIDIQITEAERRELNALSNSEGFGVKKVPEAGYVHLDGGQAMIYARIRKIDGENFRALRQQKVLTCLFEKAKKLSITKYPALLKSIMQHVETSLSYSEIIEFAPMLANSDLTLQKTSVPGDEVIAEGGIFPDTHGSWVWKYDLKEATNYIRKWIYNID